MEKKIEIDEYWDENQKEKSNLKSNRGASMECIKFIGVDPTTQDRTIVPMQVPTLPHVFAFQSDVSLNACIASSLTTLRRRTSSFGQSLLARSTDALRHRKTIDKKSTAAKILVYQRPIEIPTIDNLYFESVEEIESSKLEKFGKFLILDNRCDISVSIWKEIA